jgi:hypothetical protein
MDALAFTPRARSAGLIHSALAYAHSHTLKLRPPQARLGWISLWATMDIKRMCGSQGSWTESHASWGIFLRGVEPGPVSEDPISSPKFSWGWRVRQGRGGGTAASPSRPTYGFFEGYGYEHRPQFFGV